MLINFFYSHEAPCSLGNQAGTHTVGPVTDVLPFINVLMELERFMKNRLALRWRKNTRTMIFIARVSPEN